ncbi:MAG: hypothetical protein HYX87_08135 [Chloroflexi bacterium]|nr:hypothetical protein [Chloroflexota bacterium]
MKRKLVRLLTPVLAISAVTFAGCASSAGPTSSTKPPATSPASKSAQSTKTVQSTTPATTTTRTSPATSTSSATTTAPATSSTPAVSIFLNITEPADESVTGESTVTIKGQTTPEAVLSVNADLVAVDASGKFAVAVPLEEGPNPFDIIATDEDGNQASVQLVVSYAP